MDAHCILPLYDLQLCPLGNSFYSEGQPGPPTASAGALELARLIVPIEVKILVLYWGYMGIMEKNIENHHTGLFRLEGLAACRNQECKAGACTVHGKAAFALSAAEMS